MPVLKRDSDYHTYADYLVWSRTFGDELIDGTAYVREPASHTGRTQLTSVPDVTIDWSLVVNRMSYD